MIGRLYSLCWMNDGCHWAVLSPFGTLLACSTYGFANEEEAMSDLRYWY